MNRKIIFFDIDGTLITEGNNVYMPESARLALELLRKQGHICIINTGRPFASLDDLVRSIKVDGYICGCGTNIRVGKEILLRYHLDQELCSRIIYGLIDCGIEWMLEGEDSLYYSCSEYKTDIIKTIEANKKTLGSRIRAVEPEEYSSLVFDKFIMKQTQEGNSKKFIDMFSNDLQFIDRGRNFYEVIPTGYTKATGMRFLEEYFGISHQDTIAVGDSTNDISMLEYAATGILMGGADPVLASYADYVTTPVDQDGIYNAFVHLGLISN